MQFGGFRIQVTSAPAERARSDAARLAWLLLDPEPRSRLTAAVTASIKEGRYWIPEREISRSLVDDHLAIRP